MAPGWPEARLNADTCPAIVRGFKGFLADALLMLVEACSVFASIFFGLHRDVRDFLGKYSRSLSGNGF